MAEFIEVTKQINRMCKSIECEDCFLSKRKNGKLLACGDFVIGYPQETEEIIMDWAKEHPAMTNADKFKEVFGIEVGNGITRCDLFECNHSDCAECEYRGFWDREYVEPKVKNDY